MTRPTEPTDFGEIVAGVDPGAADGDETVTELRVAGADGGSRVIRNPDRCIVVRTVRPFGYALASVERGMNVEEESKIPAEPPPSFTAEDAIAGFVVVVAKQVAEKARQLDIDVVRVYSTDEGEAVAARLRESGFYVIEIAG